jgi:hypothetical protein
METNALQEVIKWCDLPVMRDQAATELDALKQALANEVGQEAILLSTIGDLRADLDEAIRLMVWADGVNDMAKLNGSGAWSKGSNLGETITAFLARMKEEK